MAAHMGDGDRVFASPLFFRLISTLAVLLGALAGYPLLQSPLNTAGQWLYLALLGGLTVLCLLAWFYLDAHRAAKLAAWLRTHRLFTGLLALVVVLGGLAGWVAAAQARWAWAVLPQGAWLALTLLILFGLLFSGQPRSRAIGVAVQAAFVLVCVVGTYLALDLILRANPTLVPESAWRHLRDPEVRLRANYAFFDRPVVMGYRYHADRAQWVPCRSTGLPPYRIRMVTDENGFRNTPPLSNQYDIIATGDSFTGGDFVDDPWPLLVGRLGGLSTLNLGIRGWGPQAEVEAVKAFGLPRNPDWVVVGFYEGNDLSDAAIYQQAQASGLDWIAWARSLVPQQPMDSWVAWQSLRYGLYDFAAQVLSTGGQGMARRFPVTVQVGGQSASLNFYDDETSQLSASQSDIEASANYALTEAALRDLKRATDAQGARLLLAYLPSKAHVYLPLIDDDQALTTILAGAGQVTLDDERYLSIGEPPLARDAVRAHIDDQRKAVEALANRLGIHFLDLTPVFQSETAQGRALYFPINAHWNQEGHLLAAETLADYLLKNR
jgi:hypothetical protein